eukprot:TRINITY_DN11549_c0_g2_i1.p1 TRINITY_DN11549_c0_g2~~TRINITY_DN11549_c0_g2_i1.p1  ORF type:complete len:2467 (+),score=561.09 TRINITY_DN11549_c0_g2_i1:87-7487(+)
MHHTASMHSMVRDDICGISVFGIPEGVSEEDLERTFSQFGRIEKVDMRGHELPRLRARNVFGHLYKMEKLEVLRGRVSDSGGMSTQSHTDLCNIFDGLSGAEQIERVRGWVGDGGNGDRKEGLRDMLRGNGTKVYAVIQYQDWESCGRAVKFGARRGMFDVRGRRVPLRVHLKESFSSLRGHRAPELSSQFNGDDFLDAHTLNKALTFVWTYRDELLPETVGDEFTVIQWGNAWRNVLSRELRAQSEDEWLTAFRDVFPGERAPEDEDEEILDPLMDLPGPRPEPHIWAGERDGDPCSSCSRLERIMLVEAEKIFVEVTRILDISRDGSIERNELAAFFSSTRGSGGGEGEYIAYLPDQEDVIPPYKNQHEKDLMVRAEETRRLNARTQAMKQQLVQDQNRACALLMSEKQFKKMLQCLAEVPGGGQPKLSIMPSKRKLQMQKRQVMEETEHIRKQTAAEGVSSDKKSALPVGREVVERDPDEDQGESPASPGSPASPITAAVTGAAKAHPGAAPAKSGEEEGDAESKLVINYLAKGESYKINFGLLPSEQWKIQTCGGHGGMPVPDEELLESPSYIVTKDDICRLQFKAQEHGIRHGSPTYNKIFGTMISEQDFQAAYSKATGIDLQGSAGAVWNRLTGKFGGMIPKETFFQYCRTVPVEGLDAGVGGGVYVSFCHAMQLRVTTVLNLFLFLTFLGFFTANVLSDRGLGPGYFQGLAINEFLSQELAGSTEPGEASTWWAWTFDDVAEHDEFWEFINNVLDFTYDGEGSPGVYKSVELTNNIVGGVKLHQWRVPPEECAGLDDLFTNNLGEACYGQAHTAVRIDDAAWKKEHSPNPRPDSAYATCVNAVQGPCTYGYIPREDTGYMKEYARPDPVCLKDNTPTSFNRTVRVAVFPWDSAKIIAEVFKWLAEEELGVRVEIVEITPAEALKSLEANDGRIDMALEVWSEFRKDGVQRALDSKNAVKAGNLGLTGRAGLYVNPRGLAVCPGCLRWTTYKVQENAQHFTCGCRADVPGFCGGTQPGLLDQGKCTTYACQHVCSLCKVNTSQSGPDDWCGNCGTSSRDALGLSAACDANGTKCNPRLGAIWDVHPQNGIASFGPEIFRSSKLRLNKTLQLLYTRNSDELQDRVLVASGIKGDASVTGPMAWFWYEPDPLIPLTSARRVRLPTYDPESCPTPDPVLDDPKMATTYDCDVYDQPLLKLAHKNLEEHYPDIYKLLLAIQFDGPDLDEMMVSKLRDGLAYDEVACDWLKKSGSREKWNPWLRYNEQSNAKERKSVYYKQCFPPWPGNIWNDGAGNDKESFTKNANKLAPGDVENDETQVNGTKVLSGTGFSEKLPREPKDFQDIIDASRNQAKLSSEDTYWWFRPWIYQACERTFTQPLIYGNIPSGPGAFIVYPSYSCDGYSAFFPVAWTRLRAARQVQALQDNNWIDLATRALMVEVFTYNQNTHLIVRTRYIAELSPTGGWFKMKQHSTFRLWQSQLTSIPELVVQSTLTLGLTLYFTVFTLWGVKENWVLFARSRRCMYASMGHNQWCPPLYGLRKAIDIAGYLFNPGELVDLCNYALMYITWTLRFAMIAEGLTEVNILCTRVYPEGLSYVADTWLLLDQLDGVNAILVFFRLLFFLRIIPSMDEIIETVIRAGLNIFWLLMAFVIIMCGFTLCAWVVFGNVLAGYNGFGKTFTSLLFVMLGEFDYKELDAQRPGFAFFFFFFFFVMIICILFNLIIAVIGSAYDEVAGERVNVPGFVARVLHDPDTCAWAPLDMGSWHEWVCVREVEYCVARMRYACAKRSKSPAALELQRKLQGQLMQNPRIFWKEYEQVMRDLASDDITRVFRGHAKVRLLMESAYVRQHVPDCQYEQGDHVYVRDDPPDDWRKGVMESALGAEPLVRPVGWSKAFAWKEVTVDRVQFKDSGKGQESGNESQKVRLLCKVDVDTPRGVVTLDPDIVGPGEMTKAFDIPTGTQPWRQDFVGNVRFMLPDEFGDETPIEFTAPRAVIEPLQRKVAREEENPHQDEVELLRVSDFLDGEFGKVQRPVIDFFLTQLPAKVLNVNRTGQWVHLLRHYNRWKRVASTYTKFGRTNEDLVEELHRRTLGDRDSITDTLHHIKIDTTRVREKQQQMEREAGTTLVGGATPLGRARQQSLGASKGASIQRVTTPWNDTLAREVQQAISVVSLGAPAAASAPTPGPAPAPAPAPAPDPAPASEHTPAAVPEAPDPPAATQSAAVAVADGNTDPATSQLRLSVPASRGQSGPIARQAARLPSASTVQSPGGAAPRVSDAAAESSSPQSGSSLTPSQAQPPGSRTRRPSSSAPPPPSLSQAPSGGPPPAAPANGATPAATRQASLLWPRWGGTVVVRGCSDDSGDEPAVYGPSAAPAHPPPLPGGPPEGGISSSGRGRRKLSGVLPAQQQHPLAAPRRAGSSGSVFGERTEASAGVFDDPSTPLLSAVQPHPAAPPPGGRGGAVWGM